MTKYKFHIDKGKIPDEKIKQHKDFKKLLYNYQRATKPITKVPLYKVRNKRIFLSLLLIFLVLFILFSDALFEETGMRTANSVKSHWNRQTATHQNDHNNSG